MKALVSKSELKGRVSAPPSKSYTLRGVICAALAKGESQIVNPLGSDDTEAALDVLGKVGIKVTEGKDSWQVSGGNFRAPTEDLFCRESAVTLRFMTAISALIPGTCRLTAAPSLARRPIEPLIKAMQQLGINCQQDTDKTITVKGGKLRGGLTELPGNISSQFVSALLLIAPFAEEGITIRLTTNLESQPYVLMTMECLEQFGIKVSATPDFREYKAKKQSYKPAKYSVEGDWSSASYLLAAGALGGEIEVTNLNPASLQGDKAIAEYLKQMGAEITIKQDLIRVRKSKLKALTVDLTDCTDLLPTVAVLAAVAEGTSQLTGIARARLKESDRPSALAEGLTRMGIKVVEEKNRLLITGSPAKGAEIDTRGDHRIAMAFSLLGAVAGQTMIDDAECVSKTYPEYWEILKSIGGEVKLNA
ncbi:MAG TPA: 3-phosphoshikimate 1-carboxyvinyltransferase [Dehalococcoidales bacterium]|nr:3-phosphoshikimate 1-carboxyvinyltransferase [Dehalococcoidales bacterium]